MAERLFGMETEYGLAVRGRGRSGNILGDSWAARFMQAAAECLPHLPSLDGGGFYLPNGGRLYADCGHPEMTTPECGNPWDVVRYMHAGERMLAAVARELKAREPGVTDVLVFKTNVDHSDAGTTWGCHTSFLHRANPNLLPPQIIPHLVSRIIYTGCGGLEFAGDVLRFTLSPRVQFLEQEISASSTGNRGIYHTKDESLSSQGYHRLHILCGESLCSEIALWLNMGATALIVALIEAGLRPGDPVRLRDALAAMRCFAADPTCQRSVPAASGQEFTAVQIQRHYLEMAEAHLRDDFMPPWADRVCAQWRIMLDSLENGAPASVVSKVDWAIKLCVFVNHAGRRGIRWEPWPQGKSSRWPRAGHGSHGAGALPALHQELCEIDTRFGQLGSDGVFSALARAGALTQQVAGVDNIEHALAEPPAIGRARLRGHCVQRFAAQKSRYACGWQAVLDRHENLFVDLSDPFASEERWQKAPRAIREGSHHLHAHVRDTLGRVLTYHDRGHYHAAAELLGQLRALQFVIEPGFRDEYQRLTAWVQCRRGQLDGISALDRLAQPQPAGPSFSLITDYVCAYRYQGLVPPPPIEPWIEKGRACLSQDPHCDPAIALAFLGHHGYTLMRNGRPEEAIAPLEDACHPRRRPLAHPHNLSRALAELGDVHRALGHRAQAMQLLDEAQSLQSAHDFQGDLADFTLTYRAKLEADPWRARALLSDAKSIQTALRNGMGEARTLLLEARASRESATALKPRVIELRHELPALNRCRLLAKILAHWDKWIDGAGDPDGGTDFYWWL